MFAGQLVATAIGPCASQSNTLWIDYEEHGGMMWSAANRGVGA